MAFEHHRAGDLQRAEGIYRRILQEDPAHAEALHYLGLIAHQVGKHDIAVDYLERSLALVPENAVFHSNLGLAYQALGKLDQATASYREALRLQPDYADAHNNLANALAEQEKLHEAVDCYQHALALNPNIAALHYNLAAALAKQGKLDEAAASCRQALLLKPDYFKAHLNLGIILVEQNKLEEAVEQLQDALRLDPQHAAAHNNLGNALKRLGRLDEAVANYRRALLHDPNCAQAYFNLGNLYADQMQLDLAIDCFQEAARLMPARGDAMADVQASLGSVFAEQGKPYQAIACFEKALDLRPSAWFQIALAVQLPVVYQSTDDLDSWRQRLIQEVRKLRDQNVVHDLTDKPALLLFRLPYQGLNDRDIEREIARLYRVPDPFPPPGADSSHAKIRVGFLSAYLKLHTIGHWMRGLIAHLSRDDFEVIVLSIGSHEDEIAGFIKEHADRYLELPKGLPAARRLVAEQQLDVLFYPDIGLEPVASTLAFSRLAPVQLATLGHPVTTGIDAIDYFISAETLESDEAAEHYTETLIRLKVPPIYFYRPQLPARLQPREKFGLRAEDHVYACLQSAFKFHPEFDKILGGILRGDPRATLLLSRWAAPHWEELLRQRFAATLPDVVDRIRFLPLLSYPDYLNLLALADVQLDTLHFGGGSTSYEGLAVGTPIVTLPTRFLRGRITFSHYKQMQVLDCVASDPQEYIDIALRLGTDPAFRQTIRDKILAANGVLFENAAGIRELEQFFHKAVKAASSGQARVESP